MGQVARRKWVRTSRGGLLQKMLLSGTEFARIVVECGASPTPHSRGTGTLPEHGLRKTCAMPTTCPPLLRCRANPEPIRVRNLLYRPWRSVRPSLLDQRSEEH